MIYSSTMNRYNYEKKYKDFKFPVKKIVPKAFWHLPFDSCLLAPFSHYFKIPNLNKSFVFFTVLLS